MTKFPACIRQECIVSPSDALLLGRCDQTGKRVDPRRLATRSRTWSPFFSPVFHVAIGYPCIWRLIVIDAGLTVITGVMYCRSKEQAFRFLADECETCAVARHRLTNGCLSFAARSIRIDPFVSSLLIRASATREHMTRAHSRENAFERVFRNSTTVMFSSARIEYDIARFEVNGT